MLSKIFMFCEFHSETLALDKRATEATRSCNIHQQPTVRCEGMGEHITLYEYRAFTSIKPFLTSKICPHSNAQKLSRVLVKIAEVHTLGFHESVTKPGNTAILIVGCCLCVVVNYYTKVIPKQKIHYT